MVKATVGSEACFDVLIWTGANVSVESEAFVDSGVSARTAVNVMFASSVGSEVSAGSVTSATVAAVSVRFEQSLGSESCTDSVISTGTGATAGFDKSVGSGSCMNSLVLAGAVVTAGFEESVASE